MKANARRKTSGSISALLVAMAGMSVVLSAVALTQGEARASAPLLASASTRASASPRQADLWTRENLVAWEAAPLDSKKRSPEERARMLRVLGLTRYAYLSSTNPWDIQSDVNLSHFDIDAEIAAMRRHGVHIQGWYFWLNGDDPAADPKVKAALVAFKRHGIRPHIWLPQSHVIHPKSIGELADDLRKRLPADIVTPRTMEEFRMLPDAQRKLVADAYGQIMQERVAADFPRTPEEQRRRVEREADRVQAFVKLAEPYGCQVHLYNHRDWFGVMDNQLAILDQLKVRGITNVGLIYNFSHSRDAFHDDYPDFERLWARMQPYVTQVNIAGVSLENPYATYLSEGTRELDMMRVIQRSSWRGPIGILVTDQGDTEVVLRRSLQGLDSLAVRLVAERSAPFSLFNGHSGDAPLE